MAALLAKFRISYSDLVIISTDVNQKAPKESTKLWFDGLIRHFIRREELTGIVIILKWLTLKNDLSIVCLHTEVERL